MNRIKVTSQMLAEIGYNESTMVLEIKFATNGSLYEYYQVPKNVHAELMREKSKGKYFTDKIKNIYNCKKLS